MRRIRYYFVILLLIICVIAMGCSTSLYGETTPSTEECREDMQLGVTELKLADLEDDSDEFYFWWHDGGTFGSVHRIYVVDGQGWFEYYETEPFTADFLDGGGVKVTKSYTNSFNALDYETFAVRFVEMDGIGKVVTKAKFLENYTDNGDLLCESIVFCKAGEFTFLPFDYAEALKTIEPTLEDGNLMALMTDIKRDRGADISHKLVDQVE